MTTFLFLLLLGIVTYLMVRRSVARMTRTPVWLLWLVLMMPALTLSAWTMIYGIKQPPPSFLIFGICITCLLLYWVLFQSGRRGTRPPQSESPRLETNQTNPVIYPIPEPIPVLALEPNEEANLRNCFPWSVYYIHNIEYRGQAIICRGQIRTTPTKAYQQVKANIEAKFGDRFLIMFQEAVNGKPFFILVPNTYASVNIIQPKLKQPVLALLLLFSTLITTTMVGSKLVGTDIQKFLSEPATLLRGLPYALGLMTILGVHELGHYLAARHYKIAATLPYFIPLPFFLGTFGAFIQMRTPVPDRKALFDVSIAGPIAGFLITLPILMWGLANSQTVPISQGMGLLNPDAINPQSSILLAVLAKLTLGSQLTADYAIKLHPLAFAGFLGMIVTALNLIPVGQLDGGHIVHAMFGRKTAMIIGQVSRFLILLLSLVQSGLLIWAIILLFIPLVDEPTLNDVTDLDNSRDILGLAAIGLLVLIIMPLPQAIANIIQI